MVSRETNNACIAYKKTYGHQQCARKYDAGFDVTTKRKHQVVVGQMHYLRLKETESNASSYDNPNQNSKQDRSHTNTHKQTGEPIN